MKRLWEFYEDYGRHGELHGVFEATDEEIESAIGKTVWWDEELGKHSQGEVTLTKENLKPYVSGEMGWNPLEQLREEGEL